MNDSTLSDINDTDLPALFQASDKASIKAQGRYLWLVRIDLALMILAAFLSVPSTENEDYRFLIYLSTAVVIFVAILISFSLKYMRLEKVWYGGRAVAESVKTLSWKYMVGADPFPINERIAEVDSSFARMLQGIMENKSHLAVDFNENLGDQITKKMVAVRNSSLDTRKSFYVTHRIDSQRDWYANKSTYNRKREKQFFWIGISFQIATLIITILMFRDIDFRNTVGILTTISASVFSWMQVKKYQELSQSYALAAQELGIIKANVSGVSTDEALSMFVNDGENAISREHTMWVARRD